MNGIDAVLRGLGLWLLVALLLCAIMHARARSQENARMLRYELERARHERNRRRLELYLASAEACRESRIRAIVQRGGTGPAVWRKPAVKPVAPSFDEDFGGTMPTLRRKPEELTHG